MQTDKVILDVSDNPELKEYFSRKEVGEKCKLTMTVSLDDSEGDTVVLSIDTDEDIKVQMPKGDTGQSATGKSDSAASRMYKSKQADDEAEEPAPDDEGSENEV